MTIGEIPVAVLFSAHVVIRNLSGGRRVFTDKCIFLILVDSIIATNPQLVRRKAGSHGRSCLPAPPLHAGDDLHDEKKQGRAAVGKRDEKVRADADGEQD